MNKLILTSEKTSRKSLSSIYIYIYRNTITKLFLLSFCFVGISMLAEGQYDLPVITNERGDTISYTWPLPDSALCIKDEIIIKFKRGALFLDKLCFNFTIGPPKFEYTEEDWYYYQKGIMMSQEFPIDTLIADPALREAIKEYGGIYLTRITAASPCIDTISITRKGDTINCEDYLWMKLKLNNDTSLINACIWLTYLYHDFIYGAEPNYCGHFYGVPPNPEEPYYHGVQKSLWPPWTRVESAWIVQTGSPEIKVGIIDTGIWYEHCDFGWGTLFNSYPNSKIAGGWNFVAEPQNQEIGGTSLYDPHGTEIAGIIGAFTNGPNPGCYFIGGVAGIAGGWLPDNYGCKLFGYLINSDTYNESLTLDRVIGAIRLAARGKEEGQKNGDEIHVLNISWGFDADNLSFSLRDALNYAHENEVSVVVARGNCAGGCTSPNYPSCYDPSWITSVGGLDEQHKRWESSSYGKDMDLLAPSVGSLIYTTKIGVDSAHNRFSDWGTFMGTSAAAPHVVGAIALLRSEFLVNEAAHFVPGEDEDIPGPEDYEGMLKAAATDLNYGADPALLKYSPPRYSFTLPGYDTTTGWGELNIGRVFEMLAEGYVLKHYVIEDYIEGFWSGPYDIELRSEGRNIGWPPEGFYKVDRQPLTGLHSFAQNEFVVDATNKLYIWGRKSHPKKNWVQYGGLSASQPILYETSYTEIAAGATGGNDIVPGIIFDRWDYDRTLWARTYRYRLHNSSSPPFPAHIKLYISAFGKSGTLSVEQELSYNSMIIFPNPSENTVSFTFTLEQFGASFIKIYNSLGRVVYEEITQPQEPNTYTRIIDISHLSSGFYVLEVNQGTSFIRNKLIIMK